MEKENSQSDDITRLVGMTALATASMACDEKEPATDRVRPYGVSVDRNQENMPGQSNTDSTLGINSVNNDGVSLLTSPPPRFTSLLPRTNNQVSLQASDMMGVTQTMSDGNVVDVWTFYEPGRANRGFNRDRITPAPTIEVIQNTTIQLQLITVHPHTIHLHGLDVDQANDGVPSTSGYVSGGAMPLPTPPVVGFNRLPSPHTYTFTPRYAGTYAYHCHVDTVLHLEKGMIGTIIVRPDDGNANTVWSGGPAFQREYVWHLHTFDSTWHTRAQSGVATSRYRPDYFLINGREGVSLLSDTVTALHALEGEEVLIRAVNIGYMPAEIFLDGIVFRIVSSDGRALPAPIETDRYMVYPGERYDILFTMPAGMNGIASVNYFNIMGSALLGRAQTGVTAF